MRNKYLALMTFLAFTIFVKGQQAPNAGFEAWTNPAEPDGWYTFSSGGFVNLASKDTTDKVEGNASAKIQTASDGFSLTYEILSLGTSEYAFSGGGVVYTYYPVYFPFRPDTMHFAYKYDSPGIDTATAYIKLSKGNIPLAETEITLLKSAQWSFQSIPLTSLYLNADEPDSLLIQFKSSKPRSNFVGVDGSTLHVDDVHFGYASLPSSAQELKIDLVTSVVPNPFSTQLTFSLAVNEQSTVSLHNFLGQQVLQQVVTNSTTINTEQMQDGIYFYELMDSKGTLKTGKLVKQ